MAGYYILDGNNILKSIPGFLDITKGNFTRAQYTLATLASRALVHKRDDLVEVVFDGTGMDYKFRPPQNVRVTFSKDKTADEVIIGQIKRAQDLWVRGRGFEEIVVVSDDREIRECARIFGARILRTKEFSEKIFPQSRKKAHPHFPGHTNEKIISPACQERITRELEKHFGIKRRQATFYGE